MRVAVWVRVRVHGRALLLLRVLRVHLQVLLLLLIGSRAERVQRGQVGVAVAVQPRLRLLERRAVRETLLLLVLLLLLLLSRDECGHVSLLLHDLALSHLLLLDLRVQQIHLRLQMQLLLVSVGGACRRARTLARPR